MTSLTATSAVGTSFWEPRRSLTLAAARRHSRFVKFLRLMLILACGVLLSIMAYYIIEGPDAPTIDTPDAESVRMTNPRYNGVDGDGVPYTLTADFAVRGRENLDAVRLISPILSFNRTADAPPSKMVAKEGLYDSKAATMELYTDVVVTTDDGYVCETTHARIHAVNKTVSGDQQIFCSGSFGDVRGDRYEILDDYSRFIFYDNVTGTIMPNNDSDPAASIDDTSPEDMP